MKIEVNRIPQEGLLLQESISAEGLDLETEEIKFTAPVDIKAAVYRITNTLNVSLDLLTKIATTCSRCLKRFTLELNKHLELNYSLGEVTSIDLNEDIRQEIILDYPIKFLCKSDCRGLCPKCGKDLNEGECSCNNVLLKR
jgi:uncharacterized protein